MFLNFEVKTICRVLNSFYVYSVPKKIQNEMVCVEDIHGTDVFWVPIGLCGGSSSEQHSKRT